MAAAQYKHLYNTARWRALRKECFVRDGYVCQRTGRECLGEHPAPDSPVANHRVAHRGDERLFYDINNLETVCKEVHDRDIQREEQAGLLTRGVWD